MPLLYYLRRRGPLEKAQCRKPLRDLEHHLLDRLKEHAFTRIKAMNCEARKNIEDINLQDFRNRIKRNHERPYQEVSRD